MSSVVSSVVLTGSSAVSGSSSAEMAADSTGSQAACSGDCDDGLLAVADKTKAAENRDENRSPFRLIGHSQQSGWNDQPEQRAREPAQAQ